MFKGFRVGVFVVKGSQGGGFASFLCHGVRSLLRVRFFEGSLS